MAKTKCSLTIVGMSVKTNSPEAMQQALDTLNSLLGAAFPTPEPPALPKPKRKRPAAIRGTMAGVKDVPTSPAAAEGEGR